MSVFQEFTRGAELEVARREPQRLNSSSMFFLDEAGAEDLDPDNYDLRTKLEFVGNATYYSKFEPVETEGGGHSIDVRALNKSIAHFALDHLTEVVAHAEDTEIWKPIVLVNPAHKGKDQFMAYLQPDTRDGTRRPVTIDTHPDLAIDAEYMGRLSHALDRVVAQLKHDPNRLQMRINFGKLSISRWHKNKIEYTFHDLEENLRLYGLRDSLSLTGQVPMGAIEALRISLSNHDQSLPKVVLDSLEIKKPELNLYLMSKNLAIQCHLEPIYAKQRHGNNRKADLRKTSQWAISSLTGHQQDRTHKKVTVITSCPENIYDWSLEVTREIQRAEAKPVLPFDSTALSKFCTFGGQTLEGGFPVPKVMRSFTEAHDISGILGRSSWTCPLSMQYMLEINIFHSWGTDTSLRPESTATISMYSRDWDDHMATPRKFPRPWNSSFADQFVSPYDENEIPEPLSCGDHRLSHFLSWVHWIQKTLNVMHSDDD